MTICPTCAERNHPEIERCHRCGRPLGEASIVGRSHRKFGSVLRSSALATVVILAITLLGGFVDRRGVLSAADCALAKGAIDLSFEALADQSAQRVVAVNKLNEAADTWQDLESRHFANKFSFSLPRGEHAWFEALLADTRLVSDLLSRGEIVSAELAERELVWKLKLYPQVCGQ